MARGSIADRARLGMLVMRRGVRTLGARARAHAAAPMRYVPMRADRLLIAPQDLRTADPTRASEIYGGRFAFAGKIAVCDGRSPFVLTPPSAEWAESLAGFGWLRHLRAAESNITRSHARVLVSDWIGETGRLDAIGWRPDVVGRRLIAWFTHAPFLLHDADMRFYRRFLRSLTRQVRFLRQSVGGMPDGILRLTVRIALTYAALCLAGQYRHLGGAVRGLVKELDHQILRDGGHISRNPGVLIDLLLDLLPLREAFGARNLPPPAQLINAVERIMPMLRFFRHGDGAFGTFNGMGPTPLDLLATVLAYDDARGSPVSNAGHSGYQRLEARDATLLMDTGTPPPLDVSAEAHAGCLSFELSVQRQRIIVNCGLPTVGRDGWRHVARKTASHSSLVYDEQSSCQFLDSTSLQRMIGAPVVAGPRNVPVVREEDDEAVRLRASHDGYAASHGILHQRTVMLAVDGRRLDGEDAILPSHGNVLPTRGGDGFALRFHLHPGVRAARLTHRHGVMLTLPNRDVWTFEAYDHEVELEDSVFLASPHGLSHTLQMVIRGRARQTPRIGWSFVQVDPAESRNFRRTDAQTQLPL